MEMDKCTDFLGNEIHKGDWLIRAESYSSTKWLTFSRVESEPIFHHEGRFMWKVDIRTYAYGSFGKVGKFQNIKSAMKVSEDLVPADILKAYENKE